MPRLNLNGTHFLLSDEILNSEISTAFWKKVLDRQSDRETSPLSRPCSPKTEKQSSDSQGPSMAGFQEAG